MTLCVSQVTHKTRSDVFIRLRCIICDLDKYGLKKRQHHCICPPFKLKVAKNTSGRSYDDFECRVLRKFVRGNRVNCPYCAKLIKSFTCIVFLLLELATLEELASLVERPRHNQTCSPLSLAVEQAKTESQFVMLAEGRAGQ